ncbi:MAG: hypothetical protein NT062_20835 [Proteobacteria bacterium]|nr:hypothetical protein [Pseudomonadota bacterium]
MRALLLVVVVAACANNVPQNKATGPDGSLKNAKEVRFENGEATDKGIVTYPGGDRYDWKVVQLPDKQIGSLEIKLSWKSPRPGLQLAFDVFDQYFAEVTKSKASARKKRGYTRNELVENARGKYYIRVYAVGRGDAGTYRLAVNFSGSDRTSPFPNPGDLQIPDPPRLPDVPVLVLPCSDDTFDVKKKECADYCPRTRALAPKDWPPCAGGDKSKCEAVDIENLACWEDANKRPTCPTPWRSKFKRWCKEPTTCPDPPDPEIKACKPQGFQTRVLTKSINGDDTLVTVGGGTNKGVAPGWHARLLRGNGPAFVPGGDGTIVRVDKERTTIKFHQTIDVITANDQVSMEP